MSTVTVSNSTALLSALNAAHAGDTILLAAGTYSRINIANFNKGGAVNIASASTSNEAVLTSLVITNSTGLNISNLVLSTVGAGSAFPYWISGSSNINLTKLNIHGSLDNNALNDISTGLYLSGNTNVTVTQSNFQQLNSGIGENNNTNLKIENNTFSGLAGDGIDNAQTTGVVISGNTFTNFQTAAFVHADAIQFWTAGTTKASSNITITGNTVKQGTGSQAQGIFITDQVGTLAYQNVTITNNTIIGGQWNSIGLNHAVNAVVTGNTLYSEIDPTASNPDQARLGVGNITNGVVANNIAAGYVVNGTNTGLNVGANGFSSFYTAANLALSATSSVPTDTERAPVVSSITITDSAGANPIVSAVNGTAVGVHGSTIAGYYGQLTIQQNGTYSYTATREGMTVGQTYVDNLKVTVTDSLGHSTVVPLQIDIIGSGIGTAAANTIVGGAGAETIEGLGGADSLISGTGPDTFVYTGVSDSTPRAFDTITGFKAGDIIDLTAVDPSFHLVTAFDHHANELLLVNHGGGSWDIYGDTTGSGVANFQIHLTGAVTPITAASFHL